MSCLASISGRPYLLAGAVGLHATNEFLTVMMLSSAIAEIGGSRVYAWVTIL